MTAPIDRDRLRATAEAHIAHREIPAITPSEVVALLDALDKAERERDSLRHDVERHIAIAADALGDAEALRVERDEAIRARDATAGALATASAYAAEVEAERDALAALLQRARTALADMDRACDRDLIDAIDAIAAREG